MSQYLFLKKNKIKESEVINMALIKCNECGKEMSDHAKICPNCGCPFAMAKEVNKEEIEEYNLNKTDILWYEKLGKEIPLQEIKSFQKKHQMWVMMGVFLCFLPLIPYFEYKQQDKPKTERCFLMAFIMWLIAGLIIILIFPLIME